jgi:hypothetical protein
MVERGRHEKERFPPLSAGGPARELVSERSPLKGIRGPRRPAVYNLHVLLMKSTPPSLGFGPRRLPTSKSGFQTNASIDSDGAPSAIVVVSWRLSISLIGVRNSLLAPQKIPCIPG